MNNRTQKKMVIERIKTNTHIHIVYIFREMIGYWYFPTQVGLSDNDLNLKLLNIMI